MWVPSASLFSVVLYGSSYPASGCLTGAQSKFEVCWCWFIPGTSNVLEIKLATDTSDVKRCEAKVRDTWPSFCFSRTNHEPYFCSQPHLEVTSLGHVLGHATRAYRILPNR
ncbi:hypothetical protein B0F90DRAFT_716537 [Multifurca ochricompacta]|uniref:Secreted protein n=1 Tax=Multifurca ochricompacta TaxID=376703 RepID=A0AAD4M1Z4_9AGAM|nr:hypothetical protein B0F90DRAFT_716537 [Multifurca ochricompacta]